MRTTEEAVRTTGKELVITRVFDAPRERVWKAWTDENWLMRWFGPTGFIVPVCTVELRVGRGFHLAMRSPDGTDYWVKGVYREIRPPERIVYDDYFSDKNGNIVPPTQYGMTAGFPEKTLVEISFDEQEGRTTMSMRTDAPEGKERDAAVQGWNESFDKLEKVLRQGG